MRNDPLKAIQNLIKERYFDAKAVFWSGSVSKNEGTESSDLDLIIVFEKLPNAYRETFVYDRWPIDVFVHDKETLRYFFMESKEGNGISGLLHMILNSKEVTEPTDFSKDIKFMAQTILQAGPKPWDKNEIDKERFLITDVLGDIISPVNKAEQIASVAWLYEALAQFYFRAQKKWCASGKSCIRYLQKENKQLAEDYSQSFEKVFQSGDATDLKALIIKILTPYGGLLWDGFESKAPKESRMADDLKLNSTKKEYSIFLNKQGNQTVEKIIHAGLKKFNESKIGSFDWTRFTIFAKTEDGKIVAGITGGLRGNSKAYSCNVLSVWVDEQYRLQGLGTQMFHELEKFATSEHCAFIQLDTAEFQATPFYEKIGFKTIAMLPKGFVGHNQYIMKKTL
jgi:GNAT superfamily N-acetyltransferase